MQKQKKAKAKDWPTCRFWGTSVVQIPKGENHESAIFNVLFFFDAFSSFALILFFLFDSQSHFGFSCTTKKKPNFPRIASN
jgi:hypothetical protein